MKNSDLKLTSKHYIRLTFDQETRRQIRDLWLRKKMSNHPADLDWYYNEAFAEYLFLHKIPKQARKRKRTQARLLASDTTRAYVQDLERIAKGKGMSVGAVIEEALETYLDKPENYMGKDKRRKEHRERIA